MEKKDKYIYVNDDFRLIYPELWMIAAEQLKKYGAELRPDTQLGRSSKGNLKINAADCDLIVVKKNDLTKKAKAELSRIAGYVNLVSEKAQQNQKDIQDMLDAAAPYENAASEIRKILEKPDWKFALSIKRERKNIFRMSLHYQEGQMEDISIKLDGTRLKACVGKPEILQEYFMDAAKRLAGRVHEVILQRRQQTREEFIQKQITVMRAAIVTEVSNYLATLSFDGAPVTYKVKRPNGRVLIELKYNDMIFRCTVFAANGAADISAYNDLGCMKWMYPLLQIVKNPADLDDIITADTERKLKNILSERRKQMIAQLNQCVFTLNDDLPASSYCSKLQSKAKQCLAWNIPYIDGRTLLVGTDIRCVMMLQHPYPKLENAAGFVTFTKAGIIEEDSTLYQRFENCKKDKFQNRCRAYASEAFEPYQSVACQPGAEGILYGDTVLTITQGKLTLKDYIYRTPSYIDSVSAWRKALTKNMRQIEKEFEHLALERKRYLLETHTEYVNSFLIRDIVDFVLVNEQYITANAVTQALRGTTVVLNTQIEATDGCGHHSFESADAVEMQIDALIQHDVLTTRTVNGTYGNFKILKLSPSISSILSELKVACHEHDTQWSKKLGTVIQKKIRTKGILTDPEAEIYCVHRLLNISSMDVPLYMETFSLLSNPAVLERHASEIRSLFQAAPDIIQQYVKMRYSQAKGTQLKRIIKRIFMP